MNSLLNIPPLKSSNDTQQLANLVGSSQSFVINQCAEANPQKSPLVVVVNDTPSAIKLHQELLYFAEGKFEVKLFPDWETLPYDHFSPYQDIISTRIETLYQLPSMTNGILIVPVTTLLLRLAPPSYLKQHTLVVKTGQKLELQILREQLQEAGYYAVDQVREHGEFCARGSLLDIYPMASDTPYRIDFFDDEVD